MNNSPSSFYEIYILEHNKKIIKKSLESVHAIGKGKKKSYSQNTVCRRPSPLTVIKSCLVAHGSTRPRVKVTVAVHFVSLIYSAASQTCSQHFFFHFSLSGSVMHSLFFFTYLFRYFVSFSLPPRENQLCSPTSSLANWRLPPSVKCPRAKGYVINEILSGSAQRYRR